MRPLHRNGLTSEFVKYASAMSVAAMMRNVNTLLFIRKPCCGVAIQAEGIFCRQRSDVQLPMLAIPTKRAPLFAWGRVEGGKVQERSQRDPGGVDLEALTKRTSERKKSPAGEGGAEFMEAILDVPSMRRARGRSSTSEVYPFSTTSAWRSRSRSNSSPIGTGD